MKKDIIMISARHLIGVPAGRSFHHRTSHGGIRKTVLLLLTILFCLPAPPERISADTAIPVSRETLFSPPAGTLNPQGTAEAETPDVTAAIIAASGDAEIFDDPDFEDSDFQDPPVLSPDTSKATDTGMGEDFTDTVEDAGDTDMDDDFSNHEDTDAGSDFNAPDTDLPPVPPPPVLSSPPPDPDGTDVRVGGYLALSGVWNTAHVRPDPGETDWRGLSRLRWEAGLDVESDLPVWGRLRADARAWHDSAYAFHGKSNYTDAVLDTNETELEIRDFFIEGRLSEHLDLRVGRQLVVWGKSDNIRVTDRLNPMDLREPGMVDIEDLKLPVTMTRMDGYFGNWQISAMAIHEKRFNTLPAWGSDFNPLDAPYPAENSPPENLSDTEFALALKGVFSGWDMSIYLADLYDQSPYARIRKTAFPPEPEMAYARLNMVGADAVAALGNWLIKVEAARLEGIRFSAVMNGDTGSISQPDHDYTTFDLLAGVEYSGWTDTTISLDGLWHHIRNFDQGAKQAGEKENRCQVALRVTRDLMHQRLTLTLLGMMYGEKAQDGVMGRLSAEFDLTDRLVLTTGAVVYGSGDLVQFKNAGDNDRIYVDVTYSF